MLLAHALPRSGARAQQSGSGGGAAPAAAAVSTTLRLLVKRPAARGAAPAPARRILSVRTTMASAAASGDVARGLDTQDWAAIQEQLRQQDERRETLLKRVRGGWAAPARILLPLSSPLLHFTAAVSQLTICLA